MPLVVVAKSVVVAAYAGAWNARADDTMLSTYNLVAASVSCAGYATLLINVLANTMLPAGCRFKLPEAVVIVNSPEVGRILLVFTFPAITLPVTLANPVAKTLLPEIFPLAVSKPIVVKLPPVILPDAVSSPAVDRLPTVALPVTLTRPPVNKLPPTILAALVIVDVALINPPVKILPPVVFPVTVRLASVPTCVKLEYSTFELSVLPLSALASTLDAVTPVN